MEFKLGRTQGENSLYASHIHNIQSSRQNQSIKLLTQRFIVWYYHKQIQIYDITPKSQHTIKK